MALGVASDCWPVSIGVPRSADATTPIVLLLARLGLRASEVASLELDGIDWDAGLVIVCGKRGHRIAPAISHGRWNLRDRRVYATDVQRSTSRRVFLRGKQDAHPRGLARQAAWDRFFGMRSSAPIFQPRPQARISFATRWRPKSATRRLVDRNRPPPAASQSPDDFRLCEGGPHGVTDAHIALAGVRDDHAGARPQSMRTCGATQIQAARARSLLDFVSVHGGASRILHHPGVGAHMSLTCPRPRNVGLTLMFPAHRRSGQSQPPVWSEPVLRAGACP